MYAHDASDNDQDFCHTVALDGDTIVAGNLCSDNPTVAKAGTVHVFDRQASDGSWKHTCNLIANDGGSGEIFGEAVALKKNVLIVGTYNANKVCVYERCGSTWLEKKQLTDCNATRKFGYTVAIDRNNVAVGDIWAGSGGRVSIFEI